MNVESKSKRRVIKRTQMPSNLPIWSTATVYLLLDRFHAAGWVWGVAGTVFLVLWIGSIYSLCTDELCNVAFEEDLNAAMLARHSELSPRR